MTIHGELRLPATFLRGQPMDDIERLLQALGVLPAQPQQRRWRMDPDAPGGYILEYDVTLEEPGA
jgi:hypothetical protein